MKTPVGKGSNAGSSTSGTTTSTIPPDASKPIKKPLFGTNIDTDPKTGKKFEMTISGLFIPLPGEFKAEPKPPEMAPIAVCEQGLFVPRTTQVRFQKDFNKKVKMDPLFGERIRTRESSINAARSAITVFDRLSRARKTT